MTREARPDDAATIVGFDPAWTEERWRREIAEGRVWVVERGGPPVAALCRWDLAGEFELHRITVAPAVRRRGIARALLEARLEHDRGPWLLEVAAHNAAARALYRTLGFVEVGVRKAYYPDGDAAILMRREP